MFQDESMLSKKVTLSLSALFTLSLSACSTHPIYNGHAPHNNKHHHKSYVKYEENNYPNSTSKTNPAHKALFALLENIEDLPAEESEEAMADSVFDWLDENSITYRSGAEEDEYLSRDYPYMSANSLFASPSELRLVKGFNPLVMEKVLPFVCVIPGSPLLSINVNTLLPEQALILSAMIDELSLSGAEAVIAARPETGFDSVDEFFSEVQQQGGTNLDSVKELFSINSEYFKLQTQATFVDLRFSMTTLLHAKNGEVTILARKFGGVQ